MLIYSSVSESSANIFILCWFCRTYSCSAISRASNVPRSLLHDQFVRYAGASSIQTTSNFVPRCRISCDKNSRSIAVNLCISSLFFREIVVWFMGRAQSAFHIKPVLLRDAKHLPEPGLLVDLTLLRVQPQLSKRKQWPLVTDPLRPTDRQC